MLSWLRHLSIAGKVGGAVGAIMGAVVGIAAAWPYIDPYLVAHRGYVINKVDTVQTPINELLIWKFEDAKNKAASEQADWSIKLPKESDPQTRVMIERRIDQLKVEQRQIDDRIDKLRGR